MVFGFAMTLASRYLDGQVRQLAAACGAIPPATPGGEAQCRHLSTDRAYSLTIYGSASSDKTLRIMRVIALIGIPFIGSYTASVYWVFRGKVKLDDLY